MCRFCKPKFSHHKDSKIFLPKIKVCTYSTITVLSELRTPFSNNSNWTASSLHRCSILAGSSSPQPSKSRPHRTSSSSQNRNSGLATASFAIFSQAPFSKRARPLTSCLSSFCPSWTVWLSHVFHASACSIPSSCPFWTSSRLSTSSLASWGVSAPKGARTFPIRALRARIRTRHGDGTLPKTILTGTIPLDSRSQKETNQAVTLKKHPVEQAVCQASFPARHASRCSGVSHLRSELYLSFLWLF